MREASSANPDLIHINSLSHSVASANLAFSKNVSMISQQAGKACDENYAAADFSSISR